MSTKPHGSGQAKSIHGIVIPDKLPLTGKRRRRAEMLAEQGLLDEDDAGTVTQLSPDAEQVEITPESTVTPLAADDVATDKVPLADEFIEIPVNAITISQYQPRLTFNPERLEALADEIYAAGGLNNPVNVLDSGDGTFELITGERRWRAHQLLGWETIKARVRDLNPVQARIIALTDNTAGEPLTDFEEALAIKKSMDSGEFLTIRDLSRKMGRNPGDISRLLSYFKLPESVLNLLEKNPSLASRAVASELAAASESHPEVVVEAFELLLAGRIQQPALATWVKNRIRARERKPSVTRGTRVVNLTGSRDGLTQAKITGKRIILECSGSADPATVLKNMADAMGISIVDDPQE